jgi:cyclophilin family peptidyl-prolyl cis-trans isomerase/HEAT repeat protein
MTGKLRRLVAAMVCACTAALSCDRDAGTRPLPTVPSAPSASASASAAAAERTRVLLEQEHLRNSDGVTEADLSNRDVAVRRHAARALARIADARSAELLTKTLADEDPEVVAWAAYGLGYTCKDREAATVRALVARAASWTATRIGPADPAKPGDGVAPLDVRHALADALARCGTSEAEITLRAWLQGPQQQAQHAALALGRLALRANRLDDASIVALLDAASRPQPLHSALFAFTRLQALSESVQARLLRVAQAALKSAGTGRQYAVRALGRAGEEAVEALATVLVSKDYSAGERADAARELARLGEPGQKALGKALVELAPEAADEKALVSADWGPLIATLEAVSAPRPDNRESLRKLASLPIPERASVALTRRVVTLRCHAAQLLAGAASLSPTLLACDPAEHGRIGALALLRVLDRGALVGARYQRWKQLVESSHDEVVRQAALRLMPAHPEIPRPHETVSAALRSKAGGTVATAAQVIAAYPDRASSKHPPTERADSDRADQPQGEGATSPPHQSVVEALGAAFKAKRPPDALQVRAALIDAAGALQLLSLKPDINQACTCDNPTLREHAQTALRLLGERKRRCDRVAPGQQGPSGLGRSLAPPARLRVHTDVGILEIKLDPRLAPAAVARVQALARSGFYDGTSVHRVVPGFVVQFGDRGGDGFGGSGKRPLRCETAPVPFRELAVGMALAGRDTGSSQLFVTLGSYPQLDGDYPLLGSADPGWRKLTVGDVIHKVEVVH